LRFDAPEEARQFALAHGAELEVLEPRELREYVIATAQAVLSASASAATPPPSFDAVSSAAAPATSARETGRRGL
jgi:hypothetical protein